MDHCICQVCNKNVATGITQFSSIPICDECDNKPPTPSLKSNQTTIASAIMDYVDEFNTKNKDPLNRVISFKLIKSNDKFKDVPIGIKIKTCNKCQSEFELVFTTIFDKTIKNVKCRMPHCSGILE